MYIIIHIIDEGKGISHSRMHVANRATCCIAEFDAAKADPAAVAGIATGSCLPDH
jgi:hypothetical protein